MSGGESGNPSLRVPKIYNNYDYIDKYRRKGYTPQQGLILLLKRKQNQK